jgi:NAD+ kinase
MRFFILGNVDQPHIHDEAHRLRSFIESNGGTVGVFDLAGEHDLSCESADIALVLGGDGAILRAARQMGYCQTPVLGVNLGRLGFLADLNPEEVRSTLPQVIKGDFRVTRHLMFEALVEGSTEPRKSLGLNEAVIRSGPPFHMIDLELSLDDEMVSRFLGDGLIISTPIGSTAHSLSAGGPIIGQDLHAFVVTPLCGHTLTNRPIVDSADRKYTIHIRRTTGAWLVIDGQELMPLATNNRVTIRRAPVAFQLVKVPGKSYYQTLREKLHWGTTPSYRNEPPRQ